MKRLVILIAAVMLAIVCAVAQKVSVRAHNEPAAAVFRSIMEQTDLNFIYSSELLKDMRVSVEAERRPLRKVLDEIFRKTDIKYSIKGKNVILKRKEHRRIDAASASLQTPYRPEATKDTIMLEDVIVLSRLEEPAVRTTEIGARKITADNVISTPVMFGESDVIKTLHTLPGVSEGSEGLAGMYVHGGNADENLCMLDNIPLYNVNHFAGIFSAFNPEVIRYIDFYKSSVPARYDGRLSSFMDVRTLTGIPERRHGTVKLGLNAASFNISAPIGKKTSYLIGLRRSWYDLLSTPAQMLTNSDEDGEKLEFYSYFMDLNAKIAHHFSDRLNGFASVYFGDDYLKTLDKYENESRYEKEVYRFHWGNLLAQIGMNYRFNSTMTAEFTAAFTRYFSAMKHSNLERDSSIEPVDEYSSLMRSDNSIDDWILRGDFDWTVSEKTHLRFGAGYTRHSFQPGSSRREYTLGGSTLVSTDSVWRYGANEINAYIEANRYILPSLSINAGIHGSLFGIDGRTRGGISPRLSASWHPKGDIAFKGAYTRTVQYVHQLTLMYVSLPSDQWIPITGRFKPQTADKISAGAYWQTPDGRFTASAEAYWKWMHNIIEYRDEYYLRPPLGMWDERLTAGKGSARGIDFCIEKNIGKLTGRISYSLAWADRKFREKNGGRTYPARIDNRHTIKMNISWKASKKVELNAAWVGRSGNRFTLMTQEWEPPHINAPWIETPPLRVPLNNYRLPFYHRLDLSCVVHNRRGYFTFSIYNAYCHMNTIAISRDYDFSKGKEVFQKVKMLPIIPSISYTWQF